MTFSVFSAIIMAIMGDMMIFKIYESKEKRKAKRFQDTIEIYLSKFSDLFDDEGIKKIVIDSMTLFLFSNNDNLLNDMYEAVVNNYDYNKIIEMLSKKDTLFYSLVIQAINYGKKIYNLIKNIGTCKEIHFSCNKDNLLETLSLCEMINVPVIIEGTSISLEEYQKILKGYDLSKIDSKNVFIHYQEYGGDIDINTLYDTFCQINYITDKIKKYNLSPLEKLIMVYDIVKNNFYRKEGEDENHLISRSLDNVLNSDYIVCVGYIAIINAMLKNLNINARSIICKTKKEKHCRSIIYLVDKKYNIDGVYVLDPTWDSKRSAARNIIDKYNYFLMPIEIAEKTASTELMSVINMSLSDLILLENDFNDHPYTIEEKAIKKIKIQYYLEMLFLLTDNNYKDFTQNIYEYNFLSNESKKELKYIYESIISKCKINDIDVETFIRALYNTKKIEYYLNDDKLPKECSSRLELPNTDSIDISNIKKSALKRYCKVEKLKKTKDEGFESLIYYLLYEDYLNIYLSSDIGNIISSVTNDGIKRDMLNMRLLKTLKREKVRKEIDNR